MDELRVPCIPPPDSLGTCRTRDPLPQPTPTYPPPAPYPRAYVAAVMDELRVETTKCDNAIIATMIVLQWVWAGRGAGETAVRHCTAHRTGTQHRLTCHHAMLQ